MRALLTHRRQILHGHVLDRGMRLAQSVQASRLERPHRLVVAQQPHEVRADERLAMAPMDQEQRRCAALLPQRHQHRDRARLGRWRSVLVPHVGCNSRDRRVLVEIPDVHPEALAQTRLQLHAQQ